MIEIIKEIDYACFQWLQNHVRGIGLDQVFIFLRDPIHLKWAYGGLAAGLLLRFKQKALPAIAFLGGAMGFADLTSSRVFKPLFHRLRPCQDILWTDKNWHALVDCGGGFSFTSSHAATNMAASVFLALLLQPYWGKKANLFLGWGFLIGFSQIIVGLHYPVDVLGGFIIGAFWAIALHYAYLRLPKKFLLH
jgi:membrane-associated phospholipid phosphatase